MVGSWLASIFPVIDHGPLFLDRNGLLCESFHIQGKGSGIYFGCTSNWSQSDKNYFFAIFSQIVISTLVTFAPFTIAAAISSVTALDFLGYGLPPPTPSWGELLKQGVNNLRIAPWIVISTVTALVVTLTSVGSPLSGKQSREAFDPKKFSTYE